MMRAVRWILLGSVTFAVGVGAGFAVSLLRPRKYAAFTGAKADMSPG